MDQIYKPIRSTVFFRSTDQNPVYGQFGSRQMQISVFCYSERYTSSNGMEQQFRLPVR